MPAYDGKRLTLDLVFTAWGVSVAVSGTVEVLNIRKQVESK